MYRRVTYFGALSTAGIRYNYINNNNQNMMKASALAMEKIDSSFVFNDTNYVKILALCLFKVLLNDKRFVPVSDSL